MTQIAGNIIIGVGIIFVLVGVIGILRFETFYARILVSSKVDTVGFITILAGVAVKTGLSFFSLKVLLILAFAVITNPITTHSIARSAYLSGYKVKKEDGDE